MKNSLLAVLVAAMALSAAPAEDWPQWMGPRRDGVWRERGLLERFPEGGPKVRWRMPIGTGYSGPAVVGDRIYVMDRKSANPQLKDGYAREALPGSERVVCLDARTGKEIWSREYDCPYLKISYPTGPRTTPVVQDGKVWTLGTMGDLLCLNTDGKLIWSKNLKTEFKHDPPIWGHSASLLIDGPRLITLAGGDGTAVVALDKDTGKEIWRALSSQEVCYCPPTIVDLEGKRQLIIWLSDTLSGLDPATGKVYWTMPYPENGEPQRPAPNIAQPRLAGDVLFVSSFYLGPLAVRLKKDGAEPTILYRGKRSPNPARAEMLHALISTPAVQGGYFYGTGAMGAIECIEAASGKRVWSDLKAIGGKEALFGTIFFVRNEDRYFLFTDQGELVLARLTPAGYEETGRAKLLKPSQTARGRDVVWSHPAFANKCMVARNDREIICVELASP
jgi:outer membrane protein assembly factor BamB